MLRLLEPCPFSLPHSAAVVGMRAALSAPLRRRLTGEKFHFSELRLQQGRTRPGVVLSLAQQMPGQNRDLARSGYGGDLFAASALDPYEERTQRPGCAPRGPGCL